MQNFAYSFTFTFSSHTMRFPIKKLFLSLLTFSLTHAGEFSTNPSFQGFSGLINTPNAQVTTEGHAVLHINNQFDNFLDDYDSTKKERSQEDYIVGFGLFSFMEVQGRLSESKGYHRDLSANFKLQLPYHHKYLPDLALGMQDLGGAANNYDNQYIVLDKEILFVRASLGYGHSSLKNKAKRMNGLFGGVEIKARDWLYLLAENDSVENHIALRLEMPKKWLSTFNARATIAHNLNSNDTNLAFTVDIPLYHESKAFVQQYREKSSLKEEIQTQEENFDIKESALEKSQTLLLKTKQELEKQLSDFGFENIRVATQNKNIYIEIENSIFDHNDLDALGYVLGLLATSDLKYKHYALTLLKNNLKTITISGNIEQYKEYLFKPTLTNEQSLKKNLHFNRDFNDTNIAYGERTHSSHFIPRVELSLGLTTTVGTEFGVFDYIAALRTNAYMNLYDGLVASIMYELPFANSSDFNKGGIYYDAKKMRSRVVNAMLHQTLHHQNFLNTTSIGKYKTDYFGLLNQSNYTTTSGEHALNFRYGYFKNIYQDDDFVREVYLASYRYNYAPMDIYIEAKYGKFWYGDVGGKFEFKRFFGETALSFFYKNTKITYSNGYKGEEEFAGIRLSFPLTARKLHRETYFQIKGKKDWNYALDSTVNKADGTNTLNNNFGVTPMSDLELSTEYLNRDRLSASYIKGHLDRLREIYFTYIQKKK